MAEAIAHPRADGRWPMVMAAQRDDAITEHLEMDHDEARRLEHANAIVVAERQHRGGKAARNAAVPGIEIVEPVVGLTRNPARPARLAQRFGFRLQRRQLAVGRTDQHRCAPGERFGAHPRLQPLGALRVFRRIRGIGLPCRFKPFGELGIGLPHAAAELGRSLKGDVAEVDVVECVGRPQVGIAPFGLEGVARRNCG